MSVSPRLKYPLVAGIGTTNKSVAAATSAAKMAAAAILNAADGAKPVESVLGFCLLLITSQPKVSGAILFDRRI